MIRVATLLAVLLVILPLPATAQVAPTLPVKAEIRRNTLIVTWKPPTQQHIACIEEVGGIILDCVLGRTGRYTLGPGSLQENQRLEAGDRVRVIVRGSNGAIIIQGESQVFGRTRYLPMILNKRIR